MINQKAIASKHLQFVHYGFEYITEVHSDNSGVLEKWSGKESSEYVIVDIDLFEKSVINTIKKLYPDAVKIMKSGIFIYIFGNGWNVHHQNGTISFRTYVDPRPNKEEYTIDLTSTKESL